MFSPPLHRKPIPHGTPSGYRFHGCRCQDCRQAQAVAMRAHRQYRRQHGLCAFGSHPARPGKATCRACASAESARQIARQRKGQAA